MNEKKLKLKDFRYLHNLDRSRENKKELYQLIAFIGGLILLYLSAIPIVKYSSVIDSDKFGMALIMVVGLPFVIWGVIRTWKHLINPK